MTEENPNPLNIFNTFVPKKKRKSTILRKCEDLMEILWNEGYRKEISWNVLRDYVERHCGAFRETVKDYLGKRAEYYKSRGREGTLKSSGRKGYLEKFGFIEFLNPKIVFLMHERVDADYHRAQRNIVKISQSISHKSAIETEASLDAIEKDREEEDTESLRDFKPKTKISHILAEAPPKRDLTPEEKRILEASGKKEGPS
jgi:hypothetical protein